MVVVWEIVFWGLDELMCVVIYVFNFWCGWCQVGGQSVEYVVILCVVFDFIDWYVDSRFLNIEGGVDMICDWVGYWKQDGEWCFYLFMLGGLCEVIKGYDFSWVLGVLD